MPIDVIKTIPDDTFTDLEYYVNVVSRNPLSRDCGSDGSLSDFLLKY